MPYQKCSLCIGSTYGKCCNPSCKNVVFRSCKLKKNYLCEKCKSNGLTFVRGNRLSRGKKRKSDTLLQGQPTTQQHCSEERQISHALVNSEPLEAQDHQREEIENSNTQKERQCEKCGEKFCRLKFHLKKSKNIECKNYYLLEYNCTNLEDMMLKFQNLRRQLSRSAQGRDRSKDNENRRRRRTALSNTIVSVANNFNRSCSNILTVQCVFCASYLASTPSSVNIEEIVHEVSNENIQNFKVDGVVYRCKLCTKIFNDKGRKTSVLECLRQLKETPDGFEVFSFQEYEDQSKLITVYFPIADRSEYHDSSQANLEEVRHRIMIQRGRGLLENQDLDVSDDTVSFLTQQHKVDMLDLVGCLYLKRNEQMKKIEKKILNQEIRLGLLVDNTLHLPGQLENGKLFLQDVKGTDAYCNQSININKKMQIQTGLKHLNIKIPLLGKAIKDERLAAILLRLESDVLVRTNEEVNEHGLAEYTYYVPCIDGSGGYCNDDCPLFHHTPLEYMKRINYRGPDNDEQHTVARYIQEIVNVFTEKVLRKSSEYLDVCLVFDK